jgi:Rod binding domain-containing protein
MLGPVTAAAAPADAKAAEKKKLRTACEDFESVMLGIVFKQMSASAKGGMLDQSAANKQWREMLDDERAKSMAASGGIGLADHLYRDLERRL